MLEMWASPRCEPSSAALPLHRHECERIGRPARELREGRDATVPLGSRLALASKAKRVPDELPWRAYVNGIGPSGVRDWSVDRRGRAGAVSAGGGLCELSYRPGGSLSSDPLGGEQRAAGARRHCIRLSMDDRECATNGKLARTGRFPSARVVPRARPAPQSARRTRHRRWRTADDRRSRAPATAPPRAPMPAAPPERSCPAPCIRSRQAPDEPRAAAG